ncbi:hypothetical protein FA09DRAFT_332263 [Tilletiopsis washingtonensis]|uniref:Uncharacterized protein n=1 Tax=Tilletiopsis washingtonensis TaxID=58919 RepID=A0A316Z0U2_9BASI|nr:hypothetical protein FA09DRAFT_332263 [Tilletiopsis washingtonensis]PWN95370.1 hypothetical protein FA09DRAFT_332263 [Tilletiopsis washingtonensis]
MRTLSTPMRPPAVVRRPSVGTAAAGAATRTKPHQAHAERSPSPPDTRIQAPVQRPRRTSSARANGQDGTAKPNGMASHASSRSMASAGPPATPPPAVRPYEPPATLPNMRSRRDSTPSDAMLSDFGPLGGVPSPARQRGATLGGAPGTPQRESASNSAPASPWDEVLPPAIARRVAQERLIAEGAGADGLIDTWDTRGMPLSKSQMALRDSRDREEQAARLQAINAQAEAEAKLLDEQQALEAQQQHLLPAPHLSSDKRSSDATPASVRRSGRQDASSSSQPFTNLDTARYPPHAPADARPQQPQPADDGAGCCKCSVM